MCIFVYLKKMLFPKVNDFDLKGLEFCKHDSCLDCPDTDWRWDSTPEVWRLQSVTDWAFRVAFLACQVPWVNVSCLWILERKAIRGPREGKTSLVNIFSFEVMNSFWRFSLKCLVPGQWVPLSAPMLNESNSAHRITSCSSSEGLKKALVNRTSTLVEGTILPMDRTS